MDIEKPEYNFSSDNLLSFIKNKRKHLVIIALISIVLSTIISLTIESKYKSTVILFPTVSTSVSQSLLTVSSAKKDILKFGEDQDVDQLLQVLQSNYIRTKIISKYNLMEHYGIDKTSSFPQTELYKEFDNNVSFARTEFMSIKIEVLDTEPIRAANIANNIAELVDSIMGEMHKARALKAYNIVKTEYFALKQNIQVLQDSMTKIREKGVFDYESQSEVFNDALAQAIVAGKKEGVKKLEKKLEILAKYGGKYTSIRDLLEFEIKKSSVLESKYTEAKVDLEQDLPYKYIVNNAYPAEKKSYPIRWLIVLLSTISTLILAMILLMFYDNLKKKI